MKRFGHSRGIVVVNAFYENVSWHATEHRKLAPGEKEENVVMEFRRRTQHDMLVACLWPHWSGAGEVLDSFAGITDLAAGHDRCIVPIKTENVDPWLSPDPLELGGVVRHPRSLRPALL